MTVTIASAVKTTRFNIDEISTVMDAEREGLQFLREIWPVLSVRLFGGAFQQIPEIEISDFEDCPSVRGMFCLSEEGRPYIFVHRGIFFPLGTVDKTTRMVIASQILLHEAVHMRLRERSCRDLDSHGGAFVRESRRVSKLMGMTLPVTTCGQLSSGYWPFIPGTQWSDSMETVISEYRDWADVPSGV